MTELALEADEYHALRSRERDHLMAAALFTGKHGRIPTRAETNDTVGRLTGDGPAPMTTAAALEGLLAQGLIERVDGEPSPNAKGVDVTAKGRRVLAYGAARLDAAATVESETHE
jgi:hypothetical protein